MADIPPKPEAVDAFSVPEGIPVQLRRMENAGKPAVLLLHGASAQSGTFLIPQGNSLAEFLWHHDYEPWLLDWRGSCLVTDSMSDADLRAKRHLLDLDFAASEDLKLGYRAHRVEPFRQEDSHHRALPGGRRRGSGHRVKEHPTASSGQRRPSNTRPFLRAGDGWAREESSPDARPFVARRYGVDHRPSCVSGRPVGSRAVARGARQGLRGVRNECEAASQRGRGPQRVTLFV